MKVQSKPDYLIFADEAKTGELSSFPNVLRGWGVTIDQTQSKPPLEWMNGAFNRVDSNTLYLIQQGVPEWDKSITYPVNAVTKYNGVLYTAIVANDNATPSTSTTKWKKSITDVQDATTARKGVVQLSSATNSDSETQAATPKAVKEAYDKADTADTTANNALSKTATTLQTVAGKTNFKGGLQSGGVDVLKVGDGGIALSTQTATNNIDIDAYDFKVGFYSGNNWSSTVGLPFGSTSKNEWFYLLNQNLATLGDKYKLQLLGSNGKNQLAFRNITNGVPREFVEIITTANVANYAVGLGINQTWQDVTASRAKNTTYTNNTGKPIQVAIMISQGGSAITYFYVDGLKMAVSGNISTNAERAISMIIPNGSTYMTTDNFAGWNELR